MFGLGPDNYRQLRQTIAGFPSIDKAIIYGSRARGSERPGSDIDITLLGENLTLRNTVYPLREAIEELYLPYSFDISIFESLNHAGLIAEINSEGRIFYQKSSPLQSESARKSGWKTMKLKEVAIYDKKQGNNSNLIYVGLEDIESCTMKHIGNKKPKKVASNTFSFSSRHLLYGRLRPYLQKMLLPHFDGHCSTEIFPILPGNRLNRNFLAYWMLSPQIAFLINKTCTGARMPRANMNAVLDFEIPIPSLPEQKRIVARLDSVFEQIDSAIVAAEKRLAELENLKESVLQSGLAKKSGWKTMKLKDVANVIAGQSPKGQNYNKEGNGIPFYQGKKDFGGRFIGAPTCWTTQVTKLALPDDILMSVRAPVGEINIATKKICIGRGLAALRVNSEINRDFLYYCLTQIGKSLVGSAGAIFNSVNKTQIESIAIFLPSLPEQKRIVTRLDEIFENISFAAQGITRQLECYRALKSAILSSELGMTE